MNRTFAILLALLIIGLTSLALSEDGAADGEDGAVLLRYRLKPGDVQVYKADVMMNMDITTVEFSKPEKISTVMTMRLPFSIQGTECCDDGTMLAEVRFHGLYISVDMTRDREKISVTADEKGIEVSRNGSKLISGAWGSPELKQFPDMRKLLHLSLGTRFNDRGEMLEMTNLDTLAKEFEGFEGMDFSQTLDNQVVYPEHPVGPGDSWEHELVEEFKNSALPGGKLTMAGKARYTVLEQVTHRNRSCLKLALEAAFSNPDASSGMQFEQTVEGTVFVDIATGVPLDCRLTISQRLSGTVQGIELTLKGGATVTLSYIGGKKKFDELTRTAPDERADALSCLRVPMVTKEKINIGGTEYAKGDVLSLDGQAYTVVAFKATALKLHRQSDSAVYQLGLGNGGRITYVKLLGYAK